MSFIATAISVGSSFFGGRSKAKDAERANQRAAEAAQQEFENNLEQFRITRGKPTEDGVVSSVLPEFLSPQESQLGQLITAPLGRRFRALDELANINQQIANFRETGATNGASVNAVLSPGELSQYEELKRGLEIARGVGGGSSNGQLERYIAAKRLRNFEEEHGIIEGEVISSEDLDLDPQTLAELNAERDRLEQEARSRNPLTQEAHQLLSGSVRRGNELVDDIFADRILGKREELQAGAINAGLQESLKNLKAARIKAGLGGASSAEGQATAGTRIRANQLLKPRLFDENVDLKLRLLDEPLRRAESTAKFEAFPETFDPVLDKVLDRLQFFRIGPGTPPLLSLPTPEAVPSSSSIGFDTLGRSAGAFSQAGGFEGMAEAFNKQPS